MKKIITFIILFAFLLVLSYLFMSMYNGTWDILCYDKDSVEVVIFLVIAFTILVFLISFYGDLYD